MIGVNINCKEQDFIEEILNGKKTIETRKNKSLDPYIGKRVGLIRTGKGKATLMGYATILYRKEYSTYFDFRNDYFYHLVKRNSSYDGGKYGYVLGEVNRCTPTEINTLGVVSREIPNNIK